MNIPNISNEDEVLIPPNVQYAIGVDGINTKILPAGSSPQVVYRIGDGTIHPDGFDNIDGNKYLDFYISTGATGATGIQGEDGESAYTQAVNGGYTGTQAEFYELLTNVTDNAILAEQYKDEALGYRNEAEGFKDDASLSASNASTSATQSATSASNASTSETNASSSATSASTSASTATTKASEASTSATSAQGSASSAQTSADNALASANNAETSATNSANSATASANSATEAEGYANSINPSTLLSKDIYDPTNINGDVFARSNHTGTQAISTITNLQTELDGKVETTGNETIAGVKTFSSSPIVPTPTGGTEVANKDYVDNKPSGVTTLTELLGSLVAGTDKTLGMKDTYTANAGSGLQAVYGIYIPQDGTITATYTAESLSSGQTAEIRVNNVNVFTGNPTSPATTYSTTVTVNKGDKVEIYATPNVVFDSTITDMQFSVDDTTSLAFSAELL